MKDKRHKEGSIVKIFRLVTNCLILGLILVAVPAMAGQMATVGGSGYGPYQTNQGGEFTLQALSADMLLVLNNGYMDGFTKNVVGTTNSFQTFCLEHSEYIYPYTTFNVVISDRAMDGGLAASAGGDPISIGTAWLYSQFATHTLGGYVYDKLDGGTSAANLQNAIWWLEGEGGFTYNSANPFMSAVVGTFGSDATAKANNNGTYGVGVLNMYALNGEPSTLVLLGVCLVGVAIASRRFKVQA
jgi:hypothetical protein